MDSGNKIKEGDLVLICHKSGKSFLKTVEYRTFTTEWGSYYLKELIGQDYGTTVKTSKDVALKILAPDMNDLLAKHIKRIPQIIHKKDAGIIISNLGIGQNSRVLEAGTGSAYLTTYLSAVSKEVVTCEENERHYKNAADNVKNLALNNVKIENINVADLKETGFDAVVLDLPKPEEIVPKITKNIKTGGRIAVYSPCIEQSVAAKKALEENGFLNITFIECLVRSWGTEKCIRPDTQMLGHTGFLLFARYMGIWE